MIGKLIGAAIGRRVAGRYEGAQGAIVGALVPVVMKRAFGPLGLLIGGGYLAKKIYDSRKRRTRSY
nr:hypothetical protein [uncultured Sphingosinicella sp.]